MTMKRRKFTKEEKISILKEAGTNGVTITWPNIVFTQQRFMPGRRSLSPWEK